MTVLFLLSYNINSPSQVFHRINYSGINRTQEGVNVSRKSSVDNSGW